ncbi:MAG: hypothetical protein LBM99_02915 [Bacillales bacterium]|jgi:hypothetical protein|nr:hypothetical protein [Bacillales bacterium]
MSLNPEKISKVKKLFLEILKPKIEFKVEENKIILLPKGAIFIMNELKLTAFYNELDFTDSSKFSLFMTDTRVVISDSKGEVSSARFKGESQSNKYDINKVREAAREAATEKALTIYLELDTIFSEDELKVIRNRKR